MSDTDKVEYIGDLYAYADAAARAKIGGKPLEGWQLNVQKAQKEQGISPAEFCLYRNATSDLKADKDANGESISGSKKEKVIAAINDMDFFSRTEKDWVYLLSYHGEDAQKDLRKAPWNQ